MALVISGGAARLEGQIVAPADRQSINTNLLAKRDDQWLIRTFQNNRIMTFPNFLGAGQAQ